MFDIGAAAAYFGRSGFAWAHAEFAREAVDI
jgi:hypothetical protein